MFHSHSSGDILQGGRFCLEGACIRSCRTGGKEKRSFDADAPGTEVFLATPEDTVLAKLEWYRLGDEVSDCQWRDVLGIIRLQQGRLDREYMKKWAVELKVADLLDRALREADSW